QPGEHLGGVVDGVVPHPGAGGVGGGAAGAYLGAQSAVAAALDAAGSGFTEHGEVAGEPVRVAAGDAAQAVLLRLDLLVVVVHPGDVHGRAGEGDGGVQRHRHTALHVHGAAPVEHLGTVLGAQPGGQVTGHRHRVQVPGDDHPPVPAALGAGEHRVPVPVHPQVLGG